MFSHHLSILVSALRRCSRVELLSLTLLTLGLNATAHAKPFAYITTLDSNSVSVIDTASNTVVATVLGGRSFQG